MPSADVLSLTSHSFNYRWNTAGPVGTPIFVTFSFGDTQAAYDSGSRPGYASWTEQHKVYVRQALQLWENISGIKFLEVPDSALGQIRFNMYDETGLLNATGQQLSGYGYFPSYGTTIINGITSTVPIFDNIGGDIFLNSVFYANDASSLAPGQRGFSILIHEIGHALGFKHPFEGTPTITPSHDNGDYTVMSYNRSSPSINLGPIDIEASQFYYGLNDRAYVWNPATLTLQQFGSANADVILGTELTDIVLALGGDDYLRGELGDDALTGGLGNDLIDGGAGFDRALFDRKSVACSFEQVGGAILVSAPGETDTCFGIEEFGFSDGLIVLNGIAVTSASLNLITPAIIGILRHVPSNVEAYVHGRAIDTGMANYASYIEQLKETAAASTMPSLIVYDFVNGVTPTTTHLDALTAFSQSQYNYYAKMGVSDPSIGPYEAIGMGLSETPTFISAFGGGPDSSFITNAYQQAFGRAPGGLQVAHFQSQIDYFELLYLSVGVPAMQADLRARGAVVGQMTGIAAQEATNDYKVAALAFLSDAADGSATYGIDLLGVYGA